MDSTKILTRQEIVEVVTELTRKRRSVNTRQNLVIFRLSTCCGLRVREIVGLDLRDIKADNGRPHIIVRRETGKGRKARKVPLWWDGATLAAIQKWKEERFLQNACSDDPFVCSQAVSTKYKRLSRRNAQNRWKVSTKCLGAERQAMLSIHCGRHSFVSHALAGGRSLAEVRDAVGHSNVSTTSIYLHIVPDDGAVGDLFSF